MAFNPNAAYTPVPDADGTLFMLQGGRVYDNFGNAWDDIPRSKNRGWFPPAKPNTVTVDASYFGIRAGPADMTRQLETALNASHSDGIEILLPYGQTNISEEIIVTAPDSIQSYDTVSGTVRWRTPVGVRGQGPLASFIVQNTAGIGCLRYLPAGGGFAGARFKDFCLVNTNPDYTNTGQFGIQMGGGDFDCVVESPRFDSVSGIGQYAVLRLDDCTGATFTGAFENSNFKYYCEAGYNADQFSFRDFLSSFDHPVNVSCTSSTGTTISGISAAVMPYLLKGASITGAGVPADITITAKGTTSITVSNSVTSVTSFTQHLGTLLSLLGTNGVEYSGSGWAAIANAANYINKTRGSNPNSIRFDNVLFNRAEGLLEDYGSSYALSVNDIYMEKPKKLMTFAGTGLKQFVVDRFFVSQPESLRQPMVTIASTVPQGYFRNCNTDGTPGTTTFISAPNVSGSAEFGPFEVEASPLGAVVTGGGPAISTFGVMRLGTKENGTVTHAYSTASGDLNFDALGVDTVEVTLERNGRAILGPNSTQVVPGRRLRYVFIQAGAGSFSIYLNVQYIKPDGTDWGVLAGGATGTRAVIDFIYTGTKYVSLQSAAVFS